MNGDEQLEQAIRDAERELAKLRSTIAARAHDALEARGLSLAELTRARDDRLEEVQAARDDLARAQRQRDTTKKVPASPEPHGSEPFDPRRMLIAFSAGAWIVGFIGRGDAGALRVCGGFLVAVVTWIIARRKNTSDEP